MIIWRTKYTGLDCVFRTKQDFVLGSASRGNKRKFDHGGKYDERLHKKDVETFNLNDSEYADDTMLNFTERLQLASWFVGT